jgi:hypothetical protein
MKKFIIIISLFTFHFSLSAQLFNKLEKKKAATTLSADSVYLKFYDLKTTVEKPVYRYEDIITGFRYEMPACKCIDMAGKNIGDVIVISKTLFDALVYEASRQRKRKTSRKSDLEN